jgi:hypothetical protein
MRSTHSKPVITVPVFYFLCAQASLRQPNPVKYNAIPAASR